MTELFRHRNAHRLVGVSILILLLMVAGTIFVVLHKNEAFSTKHEYFLQANQSQLRGLNKLMTVRILGEPVGTVTDISYVGQSSDVRLTMQVKAPNHNIKNVIWENSRIVVARSFGIGEPYLEIERGNDLLGAIVSNLLEREADAIRILESESENIKGRGVRIRGLVANSPAAKAGLKKGDIITSFNGIPVNSMSGLYELMAMVTEGVEVGVGVHGQPDPVIVMTAAVEPARLVSGGTIIQFQAEENKLEGLADKLSLVQESIASVEKSLVNTLTSTNDQMQETMIPTLVQIERTARSLERTSDKVRGNTLERANDTLANFDKSTKRFNAEINEISDNFGVFLDGRAGPAFDRFKQASDSLNDTSVSLGETTQKVGQEASAAIADLQTAAQSLNELLEQSRSIVDALEGEAEVLPGTVNRVNETVDSAQTVLDGISDHWLLRRSVKRSEQKKSGQSSSSRSKTPLRSLLGH